MGRDGLRRPASDVPSRLLNSVGVLRLVETVSGFGRLRVFWRATDRASTLGTVESPESDWKRSACRDEKTRKRKSVLWLGTAPSGVLHLCSNRRESGVGDVCRWSARRDTGKACPVAFSGRLIYI